MSSKVSAQRTLCFISLTSSGRLSGPYSRPVLRACSYGSAPRSWHSSTKLPSGQSHAPGPVVKKRHFHASSSRHAAPKDPYQVLGVARDAAASDIKKAYFELARKYHPDTNKDASAKDKFIEIQAAYDTVGDEKKRAAYDRYGAASQQPGFDPDAFSSGRGPFGAGNFSGFEGFASGFAQGGPQSNIFEQLFGSAFGGGGRGRTERMRGDDLEASIGISFVDACKGTKRTIHTAPIADCSKCSGTGLKSGAKRTKCHTCNGTGTRTYVIESGFHMASTCPTCQGSGSFVPKDAQCGDCSGMGKVKIRTPIEVDIPAGVEDGMTIRVPGAGDKPIQGSGPAGDLLVRVNVAASKVFQRQGANILHQARIPLHTALLGGRVRVPTLDGDVEVRVPPGTQPGEECALRGRGVSPVMGGPKGDMFVSFQVQIPRSLTKRQREILEAYADDVEGKKTAADGKDDEEKKAKSASREERGEEPKTADGWFSRAWQKAKTLIGD
ncbi:hypothetical protein SISNIDRAFT_474562 [Sistotremastrum niveocremeum HHB9708]|uniref:DnaJ homolog 1, mitochondrial n=1 Tax=Sistotremastrum niveocremeum HHB9708 TaxID=1314777 RepID=A0A164UB21_9AGAM|nr:hypothetical protein SISNIDRAFT_474562 [Sistotremastrum niveocremeum HHB9708]